MFLHNSSNFLGDLKIIKLNFIFSIITTGIADKVPGFIFVTTIIFKNPMKNLTGKKIAIIIAPKMFRDEEFKIPYDYLKSQGAIVTIASTTLSQAIGKLGLHIKPDKMIHQINQADYDSIIFVGGPGVKEFWNDKTIHNLAVSFFENNKITAAICSAPVILAKAGLIRNKKVTSFPGDESEMIKSGCNYTGNLIEKDGNIITGNGPGASKAFAELVAESL
jgi:protease I